MAPYVPDTAADREAMVRALGIADVAELFADIPASLRLQAPLQLPPPLPEAGLARHLRELAGSNADADRYTCFLGAGVYDRLVPAALPGLLGRHEFYTAYTPYQAEASQGILQATYEYQSLVCELLAMDVANASMYDGSTALAEGALLAAAATGRSKVLYPATLHPEYRDVLLTYLRNRGLEARELPHRGGTVPPEAVAAAADTETACVVVQQPNFFGCVEPAPALAAAARQAGALVLACVEPVSAAILAPPGEWGADIAVADGQSLGLAMSFGGPSVGLFAVREALLRRMPGRIVGATVDREGRRGFVLTLQAREQHIRRARATSNICTNQALCALAVAAYLALLGPRGLREVALHSLQKAHYLAERCAALPGVRLLYPETPFFHEFALELEADPEEVVRRLLDYQVLAGLPLTRMWPGGPPALLVAVTEARTREELDRYVALLEGLSV